MSNTVYHYCSVDTFLKIITNKELWLTDVTKSNDSKELQLVLDCLTEKLNQRKEITNGIRMDFIPLSMFNIFFEEFKKIEQLFHVCCFSKDHDSLSQWSMYADNATGVAIGFNSANFANLKNFDKNIDFGQIKYTLSSFSDVTDEKLKIFNNMYHSNKNDYSWYLKFMHYVIDDVLKMAYLYKNPSFEQEHECRIVYNSRPCFVHEMVDSSPVFSQKFIHNEVKLSHDFTLGEIGHYTSRGKLVSYRPLHIKDFGNIITEIIIGPKSLITPHDMEMFLISYNIGLSTNKIKISKSTYQ